MINKVCFAEPLWTVDTNVKKGLKLQKQAAMVILCRRVASQFFFSGKPEGSFGLSCIFIFRNERNLFIYLFIYLAFSLSGEGHCYKFPQLQQALLYEENWMTKSARVSQKLLSQGLPGSQVATRLLCADTRANKSIFQ